MNIISGKIYFCRPTPTEWIEVVEINRDFVFYYYLNREGEKEGRQYTIERGWFNEFFSDEVCKN